MDKPRIAGNKPIVLELAPGQYAYCACGESKNQPFCDGAHRTTSFSPEMFNLSEEKTVARIQNRQPQGRRVGALRPQRSHAFAEAD